MHNRITELFNSTGGQLFLNRHVSESIIFFQNQLFFQLALEKQKRLRHLASVFSNINTISRIFVSHTLRNLTLKHDSFEVDYLPKGYFNPQSSEDAEQKATYLSGTMVIVNSNDAREGYVQVFNRSPDTLFIVWDFDNHHMMSLSSVLSAHSDIYVPAHMDNHYQLSRFNSSITDPVAAGIIQWSSLFLAENFDEIQRAVRASTPLGMHIKYDSFVYRNQVVFTLSQNISSVGFSTLQFHERTERDRFHEWCGYKSHWIVPLLNDIPIRVFDALVTGGIPIVPESLQFLPMINAIPREYIVFYGVADIINPDNVVARANRLFDEGGGEKIMERHMYALSKHHANKRLEQILSYVSNKLQFLC